MLDLSPKVLDEVKRSFIVCRSCKQDRYIIRGLCADCAPELHAKYQAASSLCSEMFRRFEAETGKEPLAAWQEFEDFMARQPDVEEYSRTIIEYINCRPSAL